MPLHFVLTEVLLALAALLASGYALYDIMTYNPAATTHSPHVRRLQVKCLDSHDCN